METNFKYKAVVAQVSRKVREFGVVGFFGEVTNKNLSGVFPPAGAHARQREETTRDSHVW